MILPEKVGIKNKFTFSCYSGFMWDIAPEFNALLVFAEHRSLLMSTFKSMTQINARRLNNAIVYELQMCISTYYTQVLWRFPAFWKELYQQGSFKGNLWNAQCSLHNVLQICGCYPLQVGYLSSSQALADYADLITSLKVFTATVLKIYAFERP